MDNAPTKKPPTRTDDRATTSTTPYRQAGHGRGLLLLLRTAGGHALLLIELCGAAGSELLGLHEEVTEQSLELGELELLVEEAEDKALDVRTRGRNMRKTKERDD